jgi:hypothetical protein
MTNQQSAKLTEPSVGPLHNPTTFVTPQLPSILVTPMLVVLSIRHDQVDPALAAALAQRIRIVSGIGDHSFRLLSGTALGAWHFDLGECGFRKRNFMRRGTFQPNSQRKTFTVDQYHPLCALATLGFSDGRAPFLAGAKLPSRKLSSHFSRPSLSNAPNIARQAVSQTPSSSHCLRRRQQVEGDGNSSGRKRHAAPVCRIHKIPSRQARFVAHGRPRPSRRRLGWGSRGSINCHCSSLNNFCRFFMTEVHLQPASHISICLEAEPIYETRSSSLV